MEELAAMRRDSLVRGHGEMGGGGGLDALKNHFFHR